MKKLLLFLSFLLPLTAQSQNIYKLKYQTDIPIGAAGLGTLTSSYFIGKNHEAPSLMQIQSLDKNDIWKPDRWVTDVWSPKCAKASDALMYFSIVMPGLLFINKNVREEHYTGLLYVETMLLNVGVTNLVKELSRRYRPFTYNSSVSDHFKTEKDARKSFFSGHTSIAATSSFFMAKVFADLNPGSKLKPLVWTSAALLPAIMGTLRVCAGKHFVTDVLVGYITGAAIGFFVPSIHKRKELRP